MTTERREEMKYNDEIEERGKNDYEIEEGGNMMMRERKEQKERGDRKLDDEREEAERN